MISDSDRGSDVFETARDTIPQGVPEHMIELRPEIVNSWMLISIARTTSSWQ